MKDFYLHMKLCHCGLMVVQSVKFDNDFKSLSMSMLLESKKNLGIVSENDFMINFSFRNFFA